MLVAEAAHIGLIFFIMVADILGRCIKQHVHPTGYFFLPSLDGTDYFNSALHASSFLMLIGPAIILLLHFLSVYPVVYLSFMNYYRKADLK